MNEPSTHWRGRKVLVTGCTGFLGSAVVRELIDRGAAVVGLVRDRAADAEFTRHKLAARVHVVRGRADDLFRVHSALAVHEVAAVFHLTATAPNQFDRATATVLDAVRRYDPRVPVVTARPADESDTPASTVPLGVARFGEVFGAGDRATFRTVPAAILGLLSGNPSAAANDSPARDFVYVRDAARACVALGEAVAGGPGRVHDVTFRSGWALTNRAMAAAVRDVLAGNTRPIPVSDVPANALGWGASVSLPDSLAETIAWYREVAGGRPVAAPVPGRMAA